MNPFKEEPKQDWKLLKAFKVNQRIQYGDKRGIITLLKKGDIRVKWEGRGHETCFNDVSFLKDFKKPTRKQRTDVTHLKPVNGVVYLDDDYNQIDVKPYEIDRANQIRTVYIDNKPATTPLKEGNIDTTTTFTSNGTTQPKGMFDDVLDDIAKKVSKTN